MKEEFIYKKECTIQEERGLCATVAGRIVKKIDDMKKSNNDFLGDNIFIIREDGSGEKADPFSIIGVILLNAPYETKLFVVTDKENYKKYVDELAEFIDYVRY